MRHKTIALVSLIILFGALSQLQAQNLGRRSSWEAKINSPESNKPGAKIVSIEANSPLAQAGFLPDDIIVEVDNILIKDGNVWSDVTYGLRAGKRTVITVLRAGKVIENEVQFNPLGKEKHDNLDTYYEHVTSSYGITQRVIITKPKRPGKQPAIVLIGGLSCSSIETYIGRRGSNWGKTIKDLVEKSNMVVIRIEKPGVGDSEGDCSQSDFLMDLEGYRSAIRYLKSKPYVDTSKIVVYGSSMGSALAPLLANEFELAGVISDGNLLQNLV